MCRDVLSGKLAESQAGTGQWRKDSYEGDERSAERHAAHAATAALYAYTPWCCRQKAGTGSYGT